MGIYFNTGLEKFNSAIRSKIYIDKTGLLEYMNSVIDTENRYICVSRPRRFGKSITAAIPECLNAEDVDLPNVMAKVHAKTGSKFVVIIDEWDTIFREDPDDEDAQKVYLKLLRGLFKDDTSKEFLALGYLTGILPVKKYGTQSALNNFDEFTMINPEPLEEYVGFTEEEVQGLCQEYNMDFAKVKQWYDGYQLNDRLHIYNPKSVVDAMRRRRLNNYWTRTETYESLKKYISLNFDGLKDDVIEMLGGGRCPVNPGNAPLTKLSRKNIPAHSGNTVEIFYWLASATIRKQKNIHAGLKMPCLFNKKISDIFTTKSPNGLRGILSSLLLLISLVLICYVV